MSFKTVKPNHPYKEITEEVYQYVVARDGGLCQLLGIVGTEVHHIIFKSHGGTNAPNNLILLSKRGHQIQHGLINTVDAVESSILLKRVKQNEKRMRKNMV